MSIIEEIEKRLKNREEEKALNLIEDHLKAFPEDAEVLFKYYEILFSNNHLPQARNVLIRLMKIKPDDEQFKARLSMLHEIMRFQERDIYASTNLNNDPWLD